MLAVSLPALNVSPRFLFHSLAQQCTAGCVEAVHVPWPQGEEVAP